MRSHLITYLEAVVNIIHDPTRNYFLNGGFI